MVVPGGASRSVFPSGCWLGGESASGSGSGDQGTGSSPFRKGRARWSAPPQRSRMPVRGLAQDARFLVDGGWQGQPLLLETFRGGALWQRRWIEAGKDGGVVEVPVVEDMRGGFGARVTAVRNHQFMSEAAAVFVPWDDKGTRDLVRHVPRQAHARREGDLARDGQDARGEARGKGRGRAPGLHVRPEPRPLRYASAAAPGGALSEPRWDWLVGPDAGDGAEVVRL